MNRYSTALLLSTLPLTTLVHADALDEQQRQLDEERRRLEDNERRLDDDYR